MEYEQFEYAERTGIINRKEENDCNLLEMFNEPNLKKKE